MCVWRGGFIKAGLSLRSPPHIFLLRTAPKETTNRQPPTANHYQQPPTTNCRQSPTFEVEKVP